MNTALKTIVAMLVLCPLLAIAQAWHEPRPGSTERAQVMSALRSELSQYDPDAEKLRFVVRELCLSDTTGWIEADPQSAEGENRYEPVSASLRKRHGNWVVDRLACSEEACDAGTTPGEISRKIHPACM
ncbi:MAG TPA: hypothetical protein PKV34_06890 [Thermomonas sp.]|uniref:hypothetical protein n=1 Tax=Thermomonas sp. TaxID=1971895 RepID=UPI002B8D9EC5|nr:hypothetical protein [Thermomonas sp.]HQA02178.1 hypothetical protein [Thermomonas sp.]